MILLDDRKSQAGYVFTLGDTAVSWKSYKLSDVSSSTPQAEYCACSNAAAEGRVTSQLSYADNFTKNVPRAGIPTAVEPMGWPHISPMLLRSGHRHAANQGSRNFGRLIFSTHPSLSQNGPSALQDPCAVHARLSPGLHLRVVAPVFNVPNRR